MVSTVERRWDGDLLSDPFARRAARAVGLCSLWILCNVSPLLAGKLECAQALQPFGDGLEHRMKTSSGLGGPVCALVVSSLALSARYRACEAVLCVTFGLRGRLLTCHEWQLALPCSPV